ncbi:cell division protein FtsQ/DivIB [Rhodococcus sp. NBC_00294]|uniref:cell division protein FtsQ/DivIB n=1 Tax=Rhodococcus sp. NBC_00294 TaxID=2976004 RepID=UPI002E2E3439|nr:FtsQ-type POTRA domain-containing protein [Rhodococcus sp. NBC_00294]
MAGRQTVNARGTGRTRPAATPRRVGAERSTRSRTSTRAPAREPRVGRRGKLLILLALVASVAFVAVSYFGPLWAVSSVQVNGNAAVSREQVVQTLQVAEGTPLPRVDTDAAAARVAAIPKIASVRVQRVYPSTVRVTVEERVPVVFFDAADGTHLMDAEAVDFAVEPPPPGVVRMVVASPSFGNLETRAALSVLTALPGPLRSQVAQIDAPTISAVSLTLYDGRVVVWGSSEDTEYKASIALPLLTQPGQTYDVSSPDLPTIR